MVGVDDLKYMLRLLDDENEAVQDGVELALLDYEGDVSDSLAGLGLSLPDAEEEKLSHLLRRGREIRLRDEWVVPRRGLDGADGDWESFEALLRSVSDFLHDGVHLRPSLPDQLDLLAEEMEGKCHTPMELAEALFRWGRFEGNSSGMSQVENSDLAWILAERKGNPLGLALIYLLVGRRLEMTIYGCNFPGHFLAMIEDGGDWQLIDAFHGGRATSVRGLLKEHPELSDNARLALTQPCTLRDMLRRLLGNLLMALSLEERVPESLVVQELLLALDDED